MSKRMLIDTTHAEETRVVVLDGNRLEDYDVETSAKKQLKSNIYLAKIVRVEPSLQAAFVEYGGNRHGFLAFSEIHPDYYQIPVADRERLIAIQEEEARAEEAREEAAEALDGDDTDRPALEAREEAAPDIAAPDFAAPDFAADENHDAETPIADAVPESIGGEEIDGEDRGGEDRSASPQSARFLRQYKIQEVIRRRQILLVQVVKEERGNKGAALTTYISLAGRFCVLMPNSPRGGGVSRKITSAADRKRLKDITRELEIPRGMAMIIRTAGAQRPRPEIRRDCEYLLQLWDDIREQTLRAMAPSLIYEEANLIKRAIRDVYTRDIEEIAVDGEQGWKAAREFMRNLMPANAQKVTLWRDHGEPLFSYHQVEHHLDAMLQPTVQLRSGGYLVINQTEALVAIDVNSGRSTRERGIEETALRTNLEAADELARQLRLRDLAGLIVIDFIDMEARKHNLMVERRLKEALKNDRARIQLGSISHFGLLEMSRQRLRPSIAESSFVACPHCSGTGFVRGTDSAALHVLRAIEEEGGKQRAGEIVVHVASPVALYVLNHKRVWLAEIEQRHRMVVHFAGDDSLIPPQLRIDKVRPQVAPVALPIALAGTEVAAERRLPANGVITHGLSDDFEIEAPEPDDARQDEAPAAVAQPRAAPADEAGDEEHRRKRRRRRRRGGRREDVPASGQPETDGETARSAALAARDPEEPETARLLDDVDGELGLSAAGEIPPAQEPGAAPRKRGRRGGGRGRGVREPNPESEDLERTSPAYAGPTPADPFGGSHDIFDLIEQDAEPARQLAVEPAATPASLAAEALPEAVTQEDVASVPETLPLELPAQATPEPLVEAKPKRKRAATPKRATAEAAAPKPARKAATPKVAAPRMTKARKAGLAAASASEALPEPAPEPKSSGNVVQPMLIDSAASPPAGRTGWWKR